MVNLITIFDFVPGQKFNLITRAIILIFCDESKDGPLHSTYYICKTQIDDQSLIDVQSTNPCPISTSQTSVPQIYFPFFKFSNWRPLTSLTYALNDVTPVMMENRQDQIPDERFLMTKKKKKKWSEQRPKYRNSICGYSVHCSKEY